MTDFSIKRIVSCTLLALAFSASALFAAEESAENRQEQKQEAMRDKLFEANMPDFSVSSYGKSVNALFAEYEKRRGVVIAKGKKGKVGIKVYTNSGAGLATPKALVNAVIDELVERGYAKKDITIVDMSRRRLRESGFLPKLSRLRSGIADDYNGVRVADIESNKYFDKNWYYDNPLTPKNVRNAMSADDIYNPELRKSYLPVPLFLTVDFWINLPVVTDMEGLGVCASLGNASIWNMSNNDRFLKSPANASMAAAEVCAIPELRDSLIFTILSMQSGQYVGGAVFNARCTFSDRKIYLSANPVVLDFIAWEYINKNRRRAGFEPIHPQPPLLNYCKELKIGDWDLRNNERVFVPVK